MIKFCKFVAKRPKFEASLDSTAELSADDEFFVTLKSVSNLITF